MNLKEIEKRLAEANKMYSEEAMLPYKQRFPCADCVFRCKDIPNLIKANQDKDKEIERLTIGLKQIANLPVFYVKEMANKVLNNE